LKIDFEVFLWRFENFAYALYRYHLNGFYVVI